MCRIWIPPRGLEGLGLRRVDAGQGSHRLFPREVFAELDEADDLWVRQRLILSPLVSTLLDADDPVTKLAQYQGSYCVVPSVHSPMIN